MVKLQILLRGPWRNPTGIAEVRRLAQELGIKPTAEGAASVSAEIGPQEFTALFGVALEKVAPRPASGRDFGGPGGYTSPDLPVPAALQPYVQSVSVAPPHLRMAESEA